MSNTLTDEIERLRNSLRETAGLLSDMNSAKLVPWASANIVLTAAYKVLQEKGK